jgi:methyl-accepting chemotaxis protein
MTMLDHLDVKKRLGLVLLTAFFCLLALSVFSLYTMRADQLEGHETRLRNVVDSAATITEYYAKQAEEGKMPLAQAQKLAKDALRALRFDGNNYVFVYDFDGRAVLVPVNPAIEGQVMLGKTDAKGFKLWDAIVATASGAGTGYIDYWYPRPGSDVPAPKLSYIRGVPAWHWALGAGVYVDDVNARLYSEAVKYGIGILLALLVAGVIGLLASRSITHQLGGEPTELMAIMQRAASGDLSTDFAIKGGNDSVLARLKSMLTGLAGLVRDLGKVSDGLHASARTVSQETGKVLEMASRQADSISAMAAAMEEMTVAVNHIAENAQDSKTGSTAAAEHAGHGEDSARQVAGKIRDMLQTSRGASDSVSSLVSRADEIGTITAVIKEIAAQTNLLALNASIEAARAGEQGRGFAVVADEVRNLAERTAKATVEIEQMIQGIQHETREVVGMLKESVPQATEGEQLSLSTVEILRQIRDGMQEALSRVQDVAEATHEQGIASTSMAQQVERIAGGVEETRASMSTATDEVKQLERLAQALQEHMAHFKL